MANWYTLEEAQQDWADAGQMTDEQLTNLLAAAKDAVIAYAPTFNTEVPAEWTHTTDAPDVGTLTLSPQGGAVAFTLEVPGAAEWETEVAFVIPEAYWPATPGAWFTNDGSVSLSFQLGWMETPRALVLAGAADRTLSGLWIPLVPFGDVPAGYREAQLMQTRNIWNSQKASPSAGEFDNGSYGLSAFPLDWQVKQLIRPKVGLPVIG